MDSLNNHLEKNIGNESIGFCTINEQIRIESFFNSVSYYNSSCQNLLSDFLNYDELIYETQK